MAKIVSVVIPTRNEQKNLKWTLQAAMADLEGLDYELIPVLNRCHPDEADDLRRYWPFKTGHGKVLEYNDKPSCWQARNLGASEAEGKYILFLDSHVIPSPGSFRRLIEYHEGWKGVAHCALNYWLEPEAKALHGYRWQPEKFWGTWTRVKPKPPDYKVVMSGTSSSLVDRDVFNEIGGFNEHLGIYGGGEPYIDLKVQMFGYDVRMPPDCRLWHLTETRGYNWNNADLHRNFMISAFALGGEEFLEPLYQNYVKGCKGVKRYLDDLVQLRGEAILLAAPDFEWTQEHAKRLLKDVLSDFGYE